MDSAAWDARYAGSDLVWSGAANVWVEELVSRMPTGSALDVAAGEGRNAFWLIDRGWRVRATDFSPVAVERARALAARRWGEDPARAERLALAVADATVADPADRAAHDLVLVCYLHLPTQAWRAAMAAAATALRPGGLVLVIAHALRNLTEGTGGPQDPAILLDPEGVVASVGDLPLVPELVELRERPVQGAPRPALDTVVLLRRP